MNIIKNVLKKRNDENGSIIVLVAFLMTIIIGFAAFVMDLGLVYASSSKLQNVVDSSALAAARGLPIKQKKQWDDVEKLAIKYASLNGFTISDDNIIPVDELLNEIDEDSITNSNAKDVNGVLIRASTNVTYNFAKLFNFNNKVITKDAIAALAKAGGLNGLLPFCIEDGDLVAGSNISVYLDQQGMFETPGMFGIFDIGEKKDDFSETGANYAQSFQYEIRFGSKKYIYVGSPINMNPGVVPTLVKKAYDDRIGTDTCDYSTYTTHTDCPRVAIVPIVEITEHKTVVVKSFARVFLGNLIDEDGSGNKFKLGVTYIDEIEVVSGPSDAQGYETDELTNLRVIKLVQ